jgi:RimJ/RimL family protein N-acetyltransferase
MQHDGSSHMAGVTLRPLVEADIEVFDAQLDSEEAWTPLQWFGHGSSARLRTALAERRLLKGEFNFMAVVAGEELAGRVGWFERSWGPPATCTCWEISIGILPQLRGRGIGTEAQRQLVAYLFAHTRVERIQAATDVENVAEQRALLAAGFTHEGTLRRCQWRMGAWHDQHLYSVLRGE